MTERFRLATRQSALALWQSEHVAARLRAAHPGLDVQLVPMTTYALGRLVPERAAGGRSLAWVRRYGAVALLVAWLPVAGDALCLAAGAVRVRWAAALAAIAAGKLARYLVVAQAAHLF